MNTKTLGRVEIKDADRGVVEAVFATFNTVDKDGDVTLPGAFDDGATVPVSAYGHTSWEGQLPVGVATIHQNDVEAMFRAQFFMDTQHGADTFRTVKALKEQRLGEWSYGYDPAEFSFGEFDGRHVRFLARQLVHEVSPVLVGAGTNTRTLSAKAGQRNGGAPMGVVIKSAIRPHSTDVVNRAWDAAAVVGAIPGQAPIGELRSMAAWVDPGADPETKSAYSFWHHHGPTGPANVRACVAGIGVLNGGRGVDVGGTAWAGDRKGIYDHLAAHVRDADREPPELRAAGGNIKDAQPGGDLVAEIVAGLVGPQRIIEAVGRLVAAPDGTSRKLSKAKAEYLDWLAEDLKAAHEKLRSYIDTPDEQIERELMRFIRQNIGGQA